MWLLIARTPPPDVPYWPGRRWLAALDAVGWPLLWIVVSRHASVPVGIVGPVVAAVAVLCAAGRLRRALGMNHRYRFTTWRWVKVVAGLLLIGVLLKVMPPV